MEVFLFFGRAARFATVKQLLKVPNDRKLPFRGKRVKNDRTDKKVEKIKHERKTTKMLRTGERPSEWTTKFRHTKGLGEHLLGSLFGYSKTEGRLMISVGIKLLVAFE